MSCGWSTDNECERRDFAVSDVVDGMSVTVVAVVWKVQAGDLPRRVDDALANRQNES
jgi:hypothetical protein